MIKKIKIIQVGGTKTAWVKNGEDEFKKRLSRFAKLDFITVPAETKADQKQALKKEAGAILKKITNDEFACLLSVHGKNLSSSALAVAMENWSQEKDSLVFIIGGSYGVDEEVKKRADFILSFSAMTFLHEMIRIFLLEQIYRAFMIGSNSAYHKGV